MAAIGNIFNALGSTLSSSTAFISKSGMVDLFNRTVRNPYFIGAVVVGGGGLAYLATRIKKQEADFSPPKNKEEVIEYLKRLEQRETIIASKIANLQVVRLYPRAFEALLRKDVEFCKLIDCLSKTPDEFKGKLTDVLGISQYLNGAAIEDPATKVIRKKFDEAGKKMKEDIAHQLESTNRELKGCKQLLNHCLQYYHLPEEDQKAKDLPIESLMTFYGNVYPFFNFITSDLSQIGNDDVLKHCEDRLKEIYADKNNRIFNVYMEKTLEPIASELSKLCAKGILGELTPSEEMQVDIYLLLMQEVIREIKEDPANQQNHPMESLMPLTFGENRVAGWVFGCLAPLCFRAGQVKKTLEEAKAEADKVVIKKDEIQKYFESQTAMIGTLVLNWSQETRA